LNTLMLGIMLERGVKSALDSYEFRARVKSRLDPTPDPTPPRVYYGLNRLEYLKANPIETSEVIWIGRRLKLPDNLQSPDGRLG